VDSAEFVELEALKLSMDFCRRVLVCLDRLGRLSRLRLFPYKRLYARSQRRVGPGVSDQFPWARGGLLKISLRMPFRFGRDVAHKSRTASLTNVGYALFNAGGDLGHRFSLTLLLCFC
jgi:hypothetical protein